MVPPKKHDTTKIEEVKIAPIPNAILRRHYINSYPGAESYLIPAIKKPFIDPDWLDMQRFVDSCVAANNFKIIKS